MQRAWGAEQTMLGHKQQEICRACVGFSAPFRRFPISSIWALHSIPLWPRGQNVKRDQTSALCTYSQRISEVLAHIQLYVLIRKLYPWTSKTLSFFNKIGFFNKSYFIDLFFFPCLQWKLVQLSTAISGNRWVEIWLFPLWPKDLYIQICRKPLSAFDYRLIISIRAHH